jgi:hypothetical protein
MQLLFFLIRGCLGCLNGSSATGFFADTQTTGLNNYEHFLSLLKNTMYVEKHLHDRVISLKVEVLTTLTSSLFCWDACAGTAGWAVVYLCFLLKACAGTAGWAVV